MSKLGCSHPSSSACRWDYPPGFVLVEVRGIIEQAHVAFGQHLGFGEVFLKGECLGMLGQNAGHVFALLVAGQHHVLWRIGACLSRLDVHRHEGLRGFNLVIDRHGSMT